MPEHKLLGRLGFSIKQYRPQRALQDALHGKEHAIMQCVDLFWVHVTGQSTGAAA